MTKRVRTVLVLMVALAAMGLASCDHYNCATSATFGSSTCSASTPGLGSSGGGGSATAAFVFAVDSSASSTQGSIVGYTLDTSALTFGSTTPYTAPTVPINDGGVGMVVAQSQFLYVGFGSVGQLYGWSIDTTGNLTAISGSPYSANFLADFVGGVGDANMIVNPAGTILFISDTLLNQIYVYQIGTGGVLTPATGSPFPVPFEPMNLATDGMGKYLYATNGNFSTHTGSEIAAYVIGSSCATSGGACTLTTVPGSPFAFPMWLVKGEPTGQFLIGTSGNTLSQSLKDDNNLYVFSITPSGANAGAIAAVAGSPFPTQNSPFSIAVQSNPNGNLVYSFSINDTATGFNPTEGYQLSSAGVLTVDTGSPFSGVGNGDWGQFDQSGAFLMDYASFFDAGTNQVITQLTPLDVGTGGALTQPIATLTLTSPGFWVVTDPK
jgi:hypothetical protein